MSNREICYQMIDLFPEDKLPSVVGILENLCAMSGLNQTPNAETLAAMREVAEMKANPDEYPGYTDVDTMMRDLLA